MISSKVKAQMTNQVQSINSSKKYDIDDRTAAFGERIIDIVKDIRSTLITSPLVSQVVRSSTRVSGLITWRQT